jgi:hypothetical protein
MSGDCMRFRKLRIAWSVWWGLVCVLLIVLWVRSYDKWDWLRGEVFDNIWIDARSLHGEIGFNCGYDARSPLLPLDWSTHSNLQVRGHWATADNGISTSLQEKGILGFYFNAGKNSLHTSFPHWFPPIMVLVLAAASWLPFKRFSLRTLLIATTLVAGVLGLAVYAHG